MTHRFLFLAAAAASLAACSNRDSRTDSTLARDLALAGQQRTAAPTFHDTATGQTPTPARVAPVNPPARARTTTSAGSTRRVETPSRVAEAPAVAPQSAPAAAPASAAAPAPAPLRQ